jgi:hypothetical protein
VQNTAVGTYALNNSTSSYNVAVGESALVSNTSGGFNTALSQGAMYATTTGLRNIAIGSGSATSGHPAMRYSTTGSYNTAIGNGALALNTTSSYNTALGYEAGYGGTSASQFNTDIGGQAGFTGGNYSTRVGFAAGYLSTGEYNTFVGCRNSANYGCGQLMTTGDKNTIIGGFSGNQGGLDIRTSSNNIVLSDGDGNPRVWCNSEGRAIFGSPLQSLGSGYVNISHTTAGNTALVIRTSSTTYTTASVVFQNSSAVTAGSISITSASSVAYNTSSDYRLKENVVEMTGATDRLKQLNPSRFNFIADADTTVDGFIAHEVQAVVPEAITGTKDAVDADGNPVYQGIDQSKLVPLLVATIKELEARITALENA